MPARAGTSVAARRGVIRKLSLLFSMLFLGAFLPACPSANPSDGGSDAPSPCPSAPPIDGAACSGSFTCLYERCPADGVHTAACSGGTFSVSEAACEPHLCRDQTCGAEEICVERVGGALLVECAPNPCGDGPILEACACSACEGFPCSTMGRGVVCNTCLSGICP